MTVQVTIIIGQGNGRTSRHEVISPGPLVLPALAKAVKAAVAEHEDEVATLADMFHTFTDAWNGAKSS